MTLTEGGYISSANPIFVQMKGFRYYYVISPQTIQVQYGNGINASLVAGVATRLQTHEGDRIVPIGLVSAIDLTIIRSNDLL